MNMSKTNFLLVRQTLPFNLQIYLYFVVILVLGAQEITSFEKLPTAAQLKDNNFKFVPESSIPDINPTKIVSTSNNQIFSTVLTTAQPSSSTLKKSWELTESKTRENLSVNNVLVATIKQDFSQLQPSETDTIKDEYVLHEATKNKIYPKKVSSVISPNTERFDPTYSSEINVFAVSKTFRSPRSIDHITTPTRHLYQLPESKLPTLTVEPFFYEKTSQDYILGEGIRAPRKEFVSGGPIQTNLKPNPTWLNATSRRSQPDIQDIIGGIVKLLGGNVNVAAAQSSVPASSRPLRPMGIRINNRGPPKITEVIFEPTPSPAIFNSTLSNATLPSTKQPPPYPFDRPPPPPVSFLATTNQDSQKQRPSWAKPNRRPIFPDASEDTTLLSSTISTPTSSLDSSTLVITNISEINSKTSNDIKGVGEATPIILESSIAEITSIIEPTSVISSSKQLYSARPGLVLDDPDFKPGAVTDKNIPIITAPIRAPVQGEVFDVTVSAIQGPNGANTVRPQILQVSYDRLPSTGEGIITSPQEGQNYVSIDGKRTYINLFPTQVGGQVADVTAGTSPQIYKPTPPTPGYKEQNSAGPILGTGIALSNPGMVTRPATGSRRPIYNRRPPIRIDTCIVGDASTCDESQNESCKTEQEVSSCHCKPGFSRRKHRDPCRRIVSMMINIKVNKMYEKLISWSASLADKDSEEYLELEWETVRAIDSAMGMTPFSDEFLGSTVNGFLKITLPKNISTNDHGVLVNATLQLAETSETVRPQVKHDIQRHLIGVITRRNNNIGESALWVDKPVGSVSALQDIDECSSSELNDCHINAQCTNVFGTFRCSCLSGMRDPWAGNVQRSGRICEQCHTEFCNNRGQCTFQLSGDRICTCSGNFYGTQCEYDGEVLGVAIGASVAAILIIGLTLIGLCMWSRRWNRAQQKAEILSTRTGITSPVFSYMAATAASSAASVKSCMPPSGAPTPYVSLEDRLRWAHITDVMAQNHYAVQQPEPIITRSSSGMFGAYPSMPPHLSLTMQHMRPPPPPIHGPPSSSDDEDNRDLLGRNFQVPRPRSRAASVTNQSGIYYDLDYERPTPIPAPRSTLPRPPQLSPPPIPLSTYMQQGSHFFR